tara:strand:- start:137 stop:709 length:573 start_codon:yes stop_codon:yes gene_type:complete
MEYTDEQIKFIQNKKLELGFKEIPSLDSVIVQFVRKYEVFVEPPNKRDVLGGAITGAVTGMAGADVGGDMAMIQGQNKQTKIQQWTTWKQWALDHKDFESIRIEKIENPKSNNSKILEKLQDPTVQKDLEPIMDQYKKFKAAELKETKTYRTIFVSILAIFIVIAVICVSLISFWSEIENNRQENSLLIK